MRSWGVSVENHLFRVHLQDSAVYSRNVSLISNHAIITDDFGYTINARAEFIAHNSGNSKIVLVDEL